MKKVRYSTNTTDNELYRVQIDDKGDAILDTVTVPGMNTPKFNGVMNLGTPNDIDLCFDGHWEQSAYGTKTFITETEPWIFKVESDNHLYGYKIDKLEPDVSIPIDLASDVVACDSCRGWKNIIDLDSDQGMILAYIKSDGLVYYRAYAQQADGTLKWEYENALPDCPSSVTKIRLFRTNDFRVGFVLQSSGHMICRLTRRNWAGMAIDPETVRGPWFDNVAYNLTAIYYMPDINIPGDIVGSNFSDVAVIFSSKSDTITGTYIMNPDNSPNTLLLYFNDVVQGSCAPNCFKIRDLNAREFYGTNLQWFANNVLLITTDDFHNGKGDFTVVYTPGNLTNGDSEAIAGFQLTFTPVGLIPDLTDPPRPVKAYNTEVS